jgi:hypothetical protein
MRLKRENHESDLLTPGGWRGEKFWENIESAANEPTSEQDK